MYDKGGKVLASGGFGCVFSPALKCQGTTKRAEGKISKLMSVKHANEEYQEITLIKKKIDKIKNYEDYFLLYDITLCKPSKLTESDLLEYNKCSALSKNNITKANINSNLDNLMSLNLPNGGLPVDDYIYEDGSFKKIYNLHISLVELLKKGIIPMNKKNVYHCDIKDSNVLVDTKTKLKTRLIDWGLTTEYVPFINQKFPNTWRNRPFQFNVPFSVIIFSDAFVEKYTKYLKDGGKTTEEQLKPFVIDYINFWMKKRGSGHYKFINEMMYTLFNNELTSISEEKKANVIETEITMDYIINYIVDVLVHFTKFKNDGTLDLRVYLDNVFIEIVDVWGFISIYFPIIELLHENYSSLTKAEMRIFKQLQFIFVEYLYNPRHEPINMDMLFKDLKDLGNLIYISLTGKKKTSSLKTNSLNTSSNKSKKTRKHGLQSTNTFVNAAGIHNNTKKQKKQRYIKFKSSSKKKKIKDLNFLSLNKF